MNTTSNRPQALKLPYLRRVKLSRFSLYSANPNAELVWEEGVLCIIGANGLGKSTLLSAINFGLTGIVPEAARDFKSMEEYYTTSRRYFQDYFKGRILERDRADADITLEFQVGNYRYIIKRGLFDSEELREFSIFEWASGVEVFNSSPCTRRERQTEYEERLVNDIGLSTFPEFVFLQLFVFTFDERRVTLFWNPRILERALYLAFGLEPETAKQVDDLKREHESADSQVRNRQFDATRIQKRMNDLRNQTQKVSNQATTFQALTEKHEDLLNKNQEVLEQVEALRKQIADANLRLATLSAKESSLRDEYSLIFSQGLEHQIPASQHPFLAKLLSTGECGICGNEGPAVLMVIRNKLVHRQRSKGHITQLRFAVLFELT